MLKHVPEGLAKLQTYFPKHAQATADVLKTENGRLARIEKWHEKQILNSLEILRFSIFDLQRSHEEKRICTLAWIARNLLELSIWTEYCVGSDANAKRFNEDAMRDMMGWSGAVVKMNESEDGVENLSKKMEELRDIAKTKGIPELRDDYKKVREVARELGREEEFDSHFKLYSKFAHPTAWVVHSISAVDADEEFRDMFFGDAVNFAVSCLDLLRRRVLWAFPELVSHEESK